MLLGEAETQLFTQHLPSSTLMPPVGYSGTYFGSPHLPQPGATIIGTGQPGFNFVQVNAIDSSALPSNNAIHPDALPHGVQEGSSLERKSCAG